MSDIEDSEPEEGDAEVLDLGGQNLTSIQLPEGAVPKTLILDNNNLSKLDGLEQCCGLSQVNIVYQTFLVYKYILFTVKIKICFRKIHI